MSVSSTSFRLADTIKSRLAKRAGAEGITTTFLLEQLINEGIAAREYPGIVFKGPAHDRRAAVAGGPDVWEIVSRLRELDGSEERRTATLAQETELHPRLIRLALDYAAAHAGDVDERIRKNREAAEYSQRAVQRRAELLG